MPEEDQGTGNGPSAPPIPLPLTQNQKRKQYFISLGCGLIPVILFLLGFGMLFGSQSGVGIVLLLVGLFLYIVELIVTIVFLIKKRLRFAGYGLLTAFLATVIITAIGCTVLPNLIHAS